ncbi:uncharacterized protein LOC121054962 [Oryza brachyantha]|uniref:uncharacterized protein LOC121054962 n=1 Tax=Oryza brachyantha TaxID=4533 RepID=UPI001ADA6709|nr:uncharacterized protein LOC121054962 [Oryza brachyantha]
MQIMATPYLTSPRSLLLLQLLLIVVVNAGTGSTYDPKALCSTTTDKASCLKVFPTLPDDVAKVSDNHELYTLLFDYISTETYEATSLAEAMLEKKGEDATAPGKCLLSCNRTVNEVDAILKCGFIRLEDRPPIIHQNLTVLFHGGHQPPPCKSACPDRSSSNSEALLATKFHYIWSLLDLMEASLQELFPGTGVMATMTNTSGSGAKQTTETAKSPNVSAETTTAVP